MYEQQIRQILANHAKLTADITKLERGCDLYSVGLTSLTTVNLMLAIEDGFDIEFPDHMLSRQTFQSIDSLAGAVEDLMAVLVE